jgi:DNA-binding NarL/FixJ family response regulator
MIHVVLADDHQLVLDGLKLRLADAGDIEVVATATNGYDALVALEQHHPEVVILDLQMEGLDGFSALQEIRRRSLPVRVLILTAMADGASLQQAIELGADGIVLKTEPPRQIIEAIRQVAAGQVVYPRAVHNWLLRRASRQQPPLDEALSGREQDVLKLIAEGKTNQEIALELLLSQNTIKYYLQNIYRKLHVNNRTEAARMYLERKTRL